VYIARTAVLSVVNDSDNVIPVNVELCFTLILWANGSDNSNTMIGALGGFVSIALFFVYHDPNLRHWYDMIE
jgi:hypothetical protein